MDPLGARLLVGAITAALMRWAQLVKASGNLHQVGKYRIRSIMGVSTVANDGRDMQRRVEGWRQRENSKGRPLLVC